MWKCEQLYERCSYNVEDESASYMDKDSEMCVHCQSQDLPQSDSRKSFADLILSCLR